MLLSVVFYTFVTLLGACAKAPAPLRRLPDFTLTGVTVDGLTPLDRRSLSGRAWIADFVYTRCLGPCPMLSANMRGLQKKLPPSIGFLSFTVDPDFDSPEILVSYARKFSADPQRWFFVTGDRPALAALFRDGFQIAAVENDAAPAGQNIAHTTKFVLIDSAGNLRGYYDGDDAHSLDQLAKDARSL